MINKKNVLIILAVLAATMMSSSCFSTDLMSETEKIMAIILSETESPSSMPSLEPTLPPSQEPSAEPTKEPTEEPTEEPTRKATEKPIAVEAKKQTREPEPQTEIIVVKETIPPSIPAESAELIESEMALGRYEISKVNFQVYPANTTQRVLYESSNNEVVHIVGYDGEIQAVGEGVAEIICTVGEIRLSCKIIVTVPVEKVLIVPKRTYRTYLVGEVCEYDVEIYPEDATDKSYNVSISDHLDGKSTIVATAANGVTDSVEITIVDIDELAEEVLRLTNVERRDNGLPDFLSSSELNKAATVRAGETKISFSHTRPDGRDCFTAFDESGANYYAAGENIASGYTASADVVNGWMNSPGHRENIMNINFGHLGVGVAIDGDGKLYFTQTFTD